MTDGVFLFPSFGGVANLICRGGFSGGHIGTAPTISDIIGTSTRALSLLENLIIDIKPAKRIIGLLCAIDDSLSAVTLYLP